MKRVRNLNVLKDLVFLYVVLCTYTHLLTVLHKNKSVCEQEEPWITTSVQNLCFSFYVLVLAQKLYSLNKDKTLR